MCMSVKKIEERTNKASRNQALHKKLRDVTLNENIDNCSLVMASDSFEFKFIYALKRVMLGVVVMEQKLSKITSQARCKELATA